MTNSITGGDTLSVIPDSTMFVFDNEIVGSPEGLSLEVIPDDPILGSRKAPAGCMRLFGTPTENIVPGDYLFSLELSPVLTIQRFLVARLCYSLLFNPIISQTPLTQPRTLTPNLEESLMTENFLHRQ